MAEPVRTHVILDGLTDPLLGGEMSRRWAAAGFDNGVDVAGQWGWLAAGGKSQVPSVKGEEPEVQGPGLELTEAEVDRARSIGRAFGLELRDRVGNTFVGSIRAEPLRTALVKEYRSRLATVLMFGLPVLLLHHTGPFLAGHPDQPHAMMIPWVIELLLTGWLSIAGGWPILWQGALSLMHFRATADLLSSALILGALVPSAIGTLGMVVGIEPFFGGDGPACDVAVYVLVVAVTQRWMLHRSAARLEGLSMLMPMRIGTLIVAWLVAMALVMGLVGWSGGLAVGLLLAPMAAAAAINPWTPGFTSLLPTIGFTVLLLIDPVVAGYSVQGVHVEVAAGFALIQTVVMAAGWSRLEREVPK